MRKRLLILHLGSRLVQCPQTCQAEESFGELLGIVALRIMSEVCPAHRAASHACLPWKACCCCSGWSQ